MSQNDGILQFFDELSKEEKAKLRGAVDFIIEREEERKQVRQVRDIIPVKDWITSKYYLGNVAEELYPFWRDEVVDFFERGFFEWIITGSLRTGKSWAGALIVPMRVAYEMSCYDNPQTLFGLSSITKITLAYFSVSLLQARLMGFGELRRAIDGVPYFQEYFKRREDIDSILEFPRGLLLIPGSDALHVISTSLYGAMLDEANFLRTGGAASKASFAKAFTLYKETNERIRLAYTSGGITRGFCTLISSATERSSFTEDRIKKADEKTKVTVARIWDVKRNHSNKWFYVFVGSEKQDAFVIDRVEQVKDILPEREQGVIDAVKESKEEENAKIKTVYDALPTVYKETILPVPLEYRKPFLTDVNSALRSVGGVSVTPAGKYFTLRTLWRRAISDELRHPFTKMMFEVSTGDKRPLMDFFKADEYFKDGKPARHPTEKRFLRVDQSKSGNFTGFACVHAGGYMEDETTGLFYPIVEVDWVLRVLVPPKPAYISLVKIYKFIIQLRRMGMMIEVVTYDQYQSQVPIEILESVKISAERTSVDTSDKPWIDFRNLFFEDRIIMYDYPPLEEEIFNLDYDIAGHKVDHDVAHHKDISDALVGTVARLLQGAITRKADRDARASSEIGTLSGMSGSDEIDVDYSWVVGSYKYKDKLLKEKMKETVKKKKPDIPDDGDIILL